MVDLSNLSADELSALQSALSDIAAANAPAPAQAEFAGGTTTDETPVTVPATFAAGTVTEDVQTAEAVASDVENVIKHVSTGDVAGAAPAALDLIPEIHAMVSEIHAAYSEFKAAWPEVEAKIKSVPFLGGLL